MVVSHVVGVGVRAHIRGEVARAPTAVPLSSSDLVLHCVPVGALVRYVNFTLTLSHVCWALSLQCFVFEF